LAQLLSEEYPGIDFNIEGNPFAGPQENGYPGFDALVEATRPIQVTLVPDTDNQLTSDHGWDLSIDNQALGEKITYYQKLGARVSLFMDPIEEQIIAAKGLEVERIEFYTGPYAQTYWAKGAEHQDTQDCFNRYAHSANIALALGLAVNAGHDLDQSNLPLFATLPGLQEVSIGHAIICESLESGFQPTISAYVNILKS
jgi:pyridoxine 5-phosphate synthase